MRRADITIPLSVASYSELSEADRQLIDAARAATHRSYAPYSRFCVGAAIRLSNGEIVSGSNQENAAYPSGLCAERTAAFYAHSTYPDATFTAIAIAARDTTGAEIPAPIAPCGACRQSLLEYETLAGAPVKVMLAGADEIFILPSVRSLLPVAFSEIV
ncbi:MAG: cytidine deaminase [Muribaculaceae bacterium]|jgi:cytidine deaminase|nr:cytidine deaminase [Muribaculaceae bacterium]